MKRNFKILNELANVYETGECTQPEELQKKKVLAFPKNHCCTVRENTAKRKMNHINSNKKRCHFFLKESVV